jgi:DNA replication and repair protein RecF
VLLSALAQLNYRNLLTSRLELSPGVTAIIGGNATGKSNLLEAAYLATTGELPGGRIAPVVRLGQSEGFVSARLSHQGGVSTIEVGLTPGKKLLRLDGQPVRALELAKVFAAVLITPEDAALVHGAPSQRRHYLDSLLSRLSLRYAYLHRDYLRVLEQRNALLKQPYAETSLSVWSEKFVELGEEINQLRWRAARRLAELAGASYAEIASDGKQLGVALSHDGQPLAAALATSREEERARGMTVVGPHRDDLILTLDGHVLQSYGSRGEARTTALALRVAEYRLLSSKHGEAPLLLIDDFTAELDHYRRDYLLALAAATPQALVAGTEPPPRAAQRLTITGGVINAY